MSGNRRSLEEIDMEPIRGLRGLALQTPCLVWTGRKTTNGYGIYKTRAHRDQRAHRVALEEKLGRPLGPNMMALHHCDNPPCVNPDHLFEGTRLVNTRDMKDKGRDRFYSRKNGRYWSKLSESEVILIRASNEVTQAALARRFRVSQSLVQAIRAKKIWRDLA